MEFNLGTLLISIFAIGLCILPFMLDYKGRKKKEKDLLDPLKKMVQQQNGQLSQYDVCRNFVIGIDKTNNMVFFYKMQENNSISKSIDLSTIQSCRVITSHKTMTSAKGDYKAISKLELSFSPKDKSKKEEVVEFFNTDILPQLYSEVPLIEKWNKLITNQLNK